MALAGGWNVANVGAVASDLADVYGVSLATIGLFTTALFVTHTAVQFPGGRIIDRVGVVQSAAASVLLIGLGAAICAADANPLLAIAGRAISGIGTGASFIAGTVLIRSSGGSPFAQGVYGGLGMSAGGIALATIPLLEHAFGWRAPFVTSLALAAAAALAVWLVRGAETLDPPPGRGVQRSIPAGGVVGDRRLHFLALLYACTYGLGVVVANWVVELLGRHASMSDSAAGVIGGTTILLVVVTRPLGGWLVRAHPDRARVAIALSLVAGSAGTIALLAAHDPLVALAGAVLVAFGAGISFAPVITSATATRPDAPAASVGFVNGIANCAVLVGTPLLGLSFAGTGDGQAGFLVIAALWLLPLVGVARSRRLPVKARAGRSRSA